MPAAAGGVEATGMSDQAPGKEGGRWGTNGAHATPSHPPTDLELLRRLRRGVGPRHQVHHARHDLRRRVERLSGRGSGVRSSSRHSRRCP